MVVKDLSNSFNPYPKSGVKIQENKLEKEVKSTIKKKRRYKKKNNQKRLEDRFLYYVKKY